MLMMQKQSWMKCYTCLKRANRWNEKGRKLDVLHHVAATGTRLRGADADSPTFSFSSNSTTLGTGLVIFESFPTGLPEDEDDVADAATRCSSALMALETLFFGRGVPVGETILLGSTGTALAEFDRPRPLAVGVGVPTLLATEGRGLVGFGGGPIDPTLEVDELTRELLARAVDGLETEADDGGLSMDCLRSCTFFTVPSLSERMA